MTQLDILANAKAFERSYDGMQRQVIAVSRQIATTPKKHELSLQVQEMIRTVQRLSCHRSIADPDPVDWTPEQWAAELHVARSSIYKVLRIATAAGAIRGQFGALYPDVPGLLRWVMDEEPTEVTTNTMASAQSTKKGTTRRRPPSVTRTKPSVTRTESSVTRTESSATRTDSSVTRIPTSITYKTYHLPLSGEPNEGASSNGWEVVVSELKSLKPPMDQAEKAVGAAQSRGLDPADVPPLIEFWENARKLLPEVNVGYLYRWITGEKDPEEVRARLPPDPSQVSLMDRETRANMIRLRTVKRGRQMGKTPEQIEAAIERALRHEGLLEPEEAST